jgi:ATP-dependent DNA ligase
MNLRNAHKIPCARLRDTDSLSKNLPLQEVVVETKCDGHHVTVQLTPARGGAEGEVWVVSRGKEGGRKGAEASKDAAYRVIEPPAWLAYLAKTWQGPEVVLDCEMVAASEGSSNHAARKDTDKHFVAFDIIWMDKDLRTQPLRNRRWALEWVMAHLSIEHLEVVDKLYQVTSERLTDFEDRDLEDLNARIKATGVEGFVVKPLGWVYGATVGWKVKLTDTEDGVVLGYTMGKKHHLGKVTASECVGSLQVGQWVDGKLVRVADVPVGQLVLYPSNVREGDVCSFTHRGWDDANKKFRFPQWVDWRTDKPAEECLFGGMQ